LKNLTKLFDKPVNNKGMGNNFTSSEKDFNSTNNVVFDNSLIDNTPVTVTSVSLKDLPISYAQINNAVIACV
jgi:hypothetical protein